MFHTGFIHRSPKLTTTQMSINMWMDNQIILLYNDIPLTDFFFKKQYVVDADRVRRWIWQLCEAKPYTKEYILYVPFMWSFTITQNVSGCFRWGVKKHSTRWAGKKREGTFQSSENILYVDRMV